LTQLAGLQVSKDSEKTGEIFKKVQYKGKMVIAGRGVGAGKPAAAGNCLNNNTPVRKLSVCRHGSC